MERVEFSESMKTGNELVDGQHQHIVSLFNRLLDASDDSVAEVLDDLAMYVATHFHEEEKLMEASGFPSDLAAAHRKEHVALSERARRMLLDHRAGSVTSMEPVVDFLSDWLTHHIAQLDQVLIGHVRAGR